ncbi:MAG: hypothetical protein V8Q43_02890 [Christensenellaceae bacterium]
MKSEKWGKWISVLLYVALGGALGWALGNFLSSGQVELSLGEKLLLLGGALLLVYLAGMVQTILHEAGHLLFGLLSGIGSAPSGLGNGCWLGKTAHCASAGFSWPGRRGSV